MSKLVNLGGRPTKCTPEAMETFRKLVAEDLLSVTAAAGIMGLHERIIYRWRDQNPTFCQVYETALRTRLAAIERMCLGLTSEGKSVVGAIWILKNASRRLAESATGRESKGREWVDENRTLLAGDEENPLSAVVTVSPELARKIDAQLDEDI